MVGGFLLNVAMQPTPALPDPCSDVLRVAGRVRAERPRYERGGLILNNGVRWARLVGRKPIAVTVFVVVCLGALAIPLKDLHLAFPTDSTASFRVRAPTESPRSVHDVASTVCR